MQVTVCTTRHDHHEWMNEWPFRRRIHSLIQSFCPFAHNRSIQKDIRNECVRTQALWLASKTQQLNENHPVSLICDWFSYTIGKATYLGDWSYGVFGTRRRTWGSTVKQNWNVVKRHSHPSGCYGPSRLEVSILQFSNWNRRYFEGFRTCAVAFFTFYKHKSLLAQLLLLISVY